MEVLYCNQIFLFQRIGLHQLIQRKMKLHLDIIRVILGKWELTQVIIPIMKKTMRIDHFKVEIAQEENSMAFEDYKDLDLKPEKATQEEIEQLEKKYGVSEFHDTSLRAKEFLHRQEEQN